MWVIALPFLVAIADALNLIFSKFFLRRFGRLSYKEFNWIAFLGITTVLVVLSILFDLFPSGTQLSDHFWAVLALGILGALGNILFFQGLERERVGNIEPFVIFNPLAATLVASIFFPEERSTFIYGAIGLAGLVLAWANLRGTKLELSPALYGIMGFWVIYGLEVALVNHLIDFFHPVTLYLVRCLIIFVTLTVFSRPDFKIIRAVHLPFAFVLGGLAVFSVTMLYTAIRILGVAPSLFVLVISPMLVYWFSARVLKERWNRRNVIASVLVLLLVVGVSIWKIL